MGAQFFDDIRDVFQELDRDDEVRVIVLRAEGKMFTAGLDLKEAATTLLGSGDQLTRAQQGWVFYDVVKRWQGALQQLQECRKPIVCAIHNKCIGGGVDLICAGDVRFCSKDAAFSIQEVKLGIVADIGTLQRISKLVGKGTAREMAFSGDPLPADRALACGLVTRVYSSVEELHKEALAFAEQCARNSPRALHGTKIVMNYADEHSTRDGLEQVALFNSAFLETSDIQEAVMAFMQKRSPIFPSRL
eukprot:CAMPEP_0177639160 /NCGR_PEP_ID=MMETSP0447-20121125/5873_1 /TAXON_ID=0 /ORGANISM="Stygamoeba regulata, Strain BSH-02190019" /LENGTH=246 /DNA_ID=CAMNT_0019141169 /DNA_START=150 /DNA_END=890 /DNA_ORIENTATION=-